MGVPERHQSGESICRDEGIQITPAATNSPPSQQIAHALHPVPLPLANQTTVNDIIPLSHQQSHLNPNPPLDTDSRQLPPLRMVAPCWNLSQPPSVVHSPIVPIGIDYDNANESGNRGWEGKIALTPYSRPGSRSGLRSVNTSSTSLRDIDSGRW